MPPSVLRLGLNFWQAAWVAAEDPERLDRELDTLASLGVRDLRVLAGAEGPDHLGTRVEPSMQPGPGVWNERLLAGLERALAAMDARGMRAIVVLGNFWSWSGGLAQYRDWAGRGPIPGPLDGPDHCRFAAGFYRDDAARAFFAVHVEQIVQRLRAAPAVAVWEILNEPRGMQDPEGMRSFLSETAARIAALDSTRDVATGSEGSTAHPDAAGLDFAADHADPGITVTTCHLWPENWGLWDPRRGDDAQLDGVIEWSRAYLRRHAEIAAELGKPLLLEELGLARDGRSLDAAGTTRHRDRFFAAMLEEARALAEQGLPVHGVLFWAWSGEALTTSGRGGDPPHEPDGWYGIGTSDTSTLATLRAFATPAG